MEEERKRRDDDDDGKIPGPILGQKMALADFVYFGRWAVAGRRAGGFCRIRGGLVPGGWR